MSTLADRLQQALKALPNGSQADLARYCRTKAPSVSDWFTGETKTLKARSLVLAAEYLGVRPRWLLDGQGPMKPDERGAVVRAAEPATGYSSRPDLRAALTAVAAAIVAAPAGRLPSVRGQLMELLDHPEHSGRVVDELLLLLSPSNGNSGKQHRFGT